NTPRNTLTHTHTDTYTHTHTHTDSDSGSYVDRSCVASAFFFMAWGSGGACGRSLLVLRAERTHTHTHTDTHTHTHTHTHTKPEPGAELLAPCQSAPNPPHLR